MRVTPTSCSARDADRYSADNMTVATTWSVTRKYLSAEARELFELLSFFSAEPISEEILIRPVIASEPVRGPAPGAERPGPAQAGGA